MVEDIKDADKSREKQDEERIARLEKKIAELENTANTARISQTKNVDSRMRIATFTLRDWSRTW